jgi:hypothetical protein
LHNLQFNTRFFHSTSPNLKKRINNEERAKFQLDPFLKQVLVGNILGDVYLRKVSPKANVSFLDKVLLIVPIYFICKVYFKNL